MKSGPTKTGRVPVSHVKLACRLELLPGGTMREKVTLARKAGFDAIGLPGRYLADYRDEVEHWGRPVSLPFIAMSLGFDGSLLSPEAGVRKACRLSLQRLLVLCARWGIPYLNMPPMLKQDNPAWAHERREAKDGEAARDAVLLRELPPVLDVAARHGVCLLLEPVNRYESVYLNTVAHAVRLCRAAAHPCLGITADFYHMQLEELSIPDALRAAAPFLKHIHVAENTRVEPGPGSLDFIPGFHVLKTIGYTGYLEVESRTLSGPASKALLASVRYLRTRWQSA